MGYGDEIMAAGHAQRVYDADPSRRVAICDRRWHVRWHELWENNPIIAKPQDVARGEKVHEIKNAAMCRPYIEYPWHVDRPCRYTAWRARDHVGRLYLTEAELALGERLRERFGPYVVIEPSAKSRNPNKSWITARWRTVVDACRDVRFVQMLHSGESAPIASRVHHERLASFREACGVLAGSIGYVGTEGGMHHAAAALGLPAVVIFGGFISPNVTGYEGHINLVDTQPETPCGMWRPCSHCRRAMNRIPIRAVVKGVQEIAAHREETAVA